MEVDKFTANIRKRSQNSAWRLKAVAEGYPVPPTCRKRSDGLLAYIMEDEKQKPTL